MLKPFTVESEAREFPSGQIALTREEAAKHKQLKPIATTGDGLLYCEITQPVILLRGVEGRAKEAVLAASKAVKAPKAPKPEPAAKAPKPEAAPEGGAQQQPAAAAGEQGKQAEQPKSGAPGPKAKE